MNMDAIYEYLHNPDTPELRYFPHAVAAEQSDLAAVLLYDLCHRIKRQKKPLIRDRKQWTYDAMRVFADQHPYASESGIRKAFLALEVLGYIEIEKSGKYNKAGYDEKWWYHVTPKGKAASTVRRIRFAPDVAAALGIPKAVLLETFRYHYHHNGEPEWVAMSVTDLNLPHHARTIQRHLDQLVEDGILQRNPDRKHEYAIFEEPAQRIDWRQQKEPLTVAPSTLLPQLDAGKIGLLVGHSGTGKTSYSTFIAVQNALAGNKVLYITIEEPLHNIAHRMYSQEFGVNYSDLHRGNRDATRAVESALAENTSRKQLLKKNLRFQDLSGGEHPQIHEVQDAIHLWKSKRFNADLVIIDQLEFISVEADAATDDGIATGDIADALAPSRLGVALSPALIMKECFGSQESAVWVLHQVAGDCELTFATKDIAGGTDVASQFDAVVGIGRATPDSNELHVFSLIKSVPFEQMLDADFPHMRFMPTSQSGQK